MTQRFANAARTTLSQPLTASDTFLVVASGEGSQFPEARVTGSGSTWFKAVIQDADGIEIVKVQYHYPVSSATFNNIVRGTEGTTAREFAVGATVGLRLTSGDVEGLFAVTQGLGTAAHRDVVAAPIDYTEGRVPTVGWAGLGSQTGITTTNYKGQTRNSMWSGFQDPALAGVRAGITLSYSGDWLTQIVTRPQAVPEITVRSCHGGTWSPDFAVYHTGNLDLSALAPVSHSHTVAEVTGLSTQLGNKVDKATGKALSDQNYTLTEKNKLAGLKNGSTTQVTISTGTPSGGVDGDIWFRY